MPFRARMKRAFTRSSSSSSNSSSSLSKTESRGLGDPKVYQPGEPMPRPKYRAPVDKKHKARLDAFTFGTTNHRQSLESEYSPMGSRIPSRGNSIHRPAGWFTRGQHLFDQVPESADDDADISNVGGASKRHSRDGRFSHLHTRGNSIGKIGEVEHIDIVIPVDGTAHDHTPFTVADLSSALQRSISKPPQETL